MRKVNIIMFNMLSTEDWKKGIRNRNYFVMQELLKRDEVEHIAAVDYLPVTWKQKLKVAFNRIQNGEYGIRKTNIAQIDSKLTVISALDFNDLLKVINFRFDYLNSNLVVWSYFPLITDYFDAIKCKLKVFDAVDDWSAHPSYALQKNRIIDNYNGIAQKADVIFTVSEEIKNRFFQNHRRVFCIPNGVDVAELEDQNLSGETLTKNFSKRQSTNLKLTVGYVGTIQSRVNFDLVRYAAKEHFDKQFIFIGPVWKDAEIQKVKDCSNVRFTGRISYGKIGKNLNTFDVAIIPHKIDEFTTSMNPLKFYEYLALGLPVVSTARLSKDEDLCYFADSTAGFSSMINKAIAQNSGDKIIKRKAFAKEQSWKKKVDEMMDCLKSALQPG